MKICYFADANTLHAQRWVKHFTERGHEVHLISVKNAEITGVNFYYISPLIKIPYFSYLGSLPFKIRTIKQLIKEINPDIVHGHYLLEHGFYAAASGFKPLVVSAWGSDVLVSPKKSIINRLTLKYVLKKADIVLGESEKIKNEILKYHTTKKIMVIPWGCNTKDFNPTIKSDEIKGSLSINNSLIIISTRHFSPVYNVDTLIKAIPIVTKEISDAKFILKNFKGGISFKSKMEDLAKNLNVYHHIMFVDEVEYNELPKYLNTADIYVSTSLSDSCSVSMLEAMACGLPVVVSDEPSNLEWIKDGWNGYIFPRKDHEALAEKLIILLKDKEKRELFGKRNREIIEERGDWDKNMEKVEQLYENLINKYQK
ncbi:putative glycosyltransferase [groundwater metagenome]|uniref:Putative glycosyltransferase n=1 Tax=groundwater metagenome TaxID=717931 RepID=A0A098EBU0_9ZZZZ